MSDPAAKVFLTGGSGFVGRGVLGALVSEGREVVALARSPAAAAGLEALGASPLPGNILDEAALASGMAGCEGVSPVARRNAFCLPDPPPLLRATVAPPLPLP